jgi:FKBP-type peptidyl-prolyl cis-trans isomerase FkpA
MRFLNARRSFRTSLFLTVLVAAAACGDNPAQPSILVATDLAVGTGATAIIGRVATVHYTGWLFDADKAESKGSQFDSSIGGAPYSFTLGVGQVIAGWDQGIPGMRVGGRRRLVIPPSLGYGSSGSGPIPGNRGLVFDVELLNVQ